MISKITEEEEYVGNGGRVGKRGRGGPAASECYYGCGVSVRRNEHHALVVPRAYRTVAHSPDRLLCDAHGACSSWVTGLNSTFSITTLGIFVTPSRCRGAMLSAPRMRVCASRWSTDARYGSTSSPALRFVLASHQLPNLPETIHGGEHYRHRSVIPECPRHVTISAHVHVPRLLWLTNTSLSVPSTSMSTFLPLIAL